MGAQTLVMGLSEVPRGQAAARVPSRDPKVRALRHPPPRERELLQHFARVLRFRVRPAVESEVPSWVGRELYCATAAVSACSVSTALLKL